MTIPVFIFIYLPVAWLIISSISTRAELLSTPIHWIPQQPTLQNYINIITPGSSTSEVARTFKITLLNSLIVSSSVTIIALVVGSLEFFFALIFASTVAAKTVPVAIAEFTGRYVVDVGGMMTGGVLAAIPPVLLSLIFQRYIVSGLITGTVKG